MRELQRHQASVDFTLRHIEKGATIMDLGVKNKLGIKLGKYYNVINTTGQDLDVHWRALKPFDTFTAFEIFEHLYAPFNLLNEISGRLIASVPVNLWFQDQWQNPKDPLDTHYHEFAPWQFNNLLKRTGWGIKDTKLLKTYEPLKTLRVRQAVLRRLYPRIYFVYAEKNLHLK